ncbi:hypothetical protein KR093_010382 [Drosophila rubida]|uniref:Protein encore n=1 Tax=Drosophila rubida TaxID=30044 RepID=A0AAD4JZ17_9MUSC|nr:hypothetical protein KR093_010382 [Drosophila rubida]
MSSTKSQVALATNIPTNLASASASATSSAAAAVVVVAAVASNNSTTSPATGAASSAVAAATTTTAAQAVTSSAAAATTATTVSTITTQTSASNNNNNSNSNNNCSNSSSNEDTSSAPNLGRQNSFGNRRGNMKGKHLTRSHAMRESTSPPRTPTPRAASEQQQHPSDAHEHNNNNNNNSNAILNNNSNTNTNTNSKAQSTGRGNSPLMETPAVIVTSQQQQQQQQQQQPLNVPLRDEQEFPKLSPPKKSGAGQHNRTNSNGSSGIEYNNNNSSSGGGGGGNNNNGKKYVVDLKANGLDKHHNSSSNTSNNNNNNNNSSNNSGTVLYNSGMNYKAAERHERHERHEMSSQNSNLSNSNHEEEQYHYERAAGGGGGGGKKHRANTNSKGSKPRVKNLTGSSSGSIDGGAGSGGGGAGPGGGGGGAAGVNNCSSNSQALNSNNSSNNTSGFISRENSSEQYTDFGGTDLLTFFRDTLNKNPKDRNILLKIEKDLMEFVQDKSRGCEYRFPATSSYNRMLIHRTAAFFGMDHNVDSDTQQCVIVAVTKGTRIPEIRFKSLVRGDHRDDARKSILKRDTHSFDEVRQSPYLCPERVMLDRKAKSFEEREEDYDRARSRIFNRTAQQDGYGNEMPNDECYGGGGGGGNSGGWHNAVEQQQQQQQPPRPKRPNGKMLQMQNSTESRDGGGMRSGGAVPKSHNFGNYGGPPSAGGPGGGNSLPRGDSTNSSKSGRGGFTKQDSTGSTSAPWRLSPSSSGYKTRTQSVRSDSVTPSPTGYGSDRQTPEFSQQPGLREGQAQSCGRGMGSSSSSSSYMQQAATPIATATTTTTTTAASSAPDSASASGLVWAVTDISSVPIGSVLIDPQTLQPILNPDGSIYHYDPSNLPPNQALQHQAGNNGGGGGGGNYQSSGNYAPYRKSSPHQPPPQQQQQQQQQQSHQQQSAQQQVYSNELSSSSTESYVEEVQSPGMECSDGYDNYPTDSQQQQVPLDGKGDECDSLSSATGCLSITTSTSTKNYDRIEVQKYKNQATSPNIPACCAADKELEVVAQQQQQQQQQPPQLPQDVEQETVVVSATGLSGGGGGSSSSSSTSAPPAELPQSQTPLPVVPLAQNCDAQSLSPSSTPYSQCDVKPASQSQALVAVEEPKTTTWAYTQSYQAPDGSTVFHTTTTPNGAGPYCATTYQQGVSIAAHCLIAATTNTTVRLQPDGSIYAVPQGMVYAAYPQSAVSSAASQPLFQLTGSSQPTQALFASQEGGELPGGTYMIPKRNNLSGNNGGGMGAPAPGRKPYHLGGYNPRHSVPLGGMPAGAKTPLLNSNNEPTPRASPSSVSLGGPGAHATSSSYHHAAHRGPPPALGKRDMKPAQMPLISGPPPSYATSSSPAGQAGYEAKPPVRLNAGAASFRSQKSINTDFRRSVSQRNSPSANGAGNGNNSGSSGHSHESSNNSPNSIAGVGVGGGGNNSNNNSAANTPNATATNLGGTQYIVVDHATGAAVNTSPPSLYLSSGSNAGGGAGGGGGGGGNGAGPRASHIPAQLHHNAVLSGVAALGGYNPNAASGVYIKYGQTYFAHPSVTLPNNRRSPSSDIRPQMAQVTGMYPAAMMIQAPPRHPSRHPNPNYKGSRPR